jgi:conserved oligomeric Golgi complex subunit 8
MYLRINQSLMDLLEIPSLFDTLIRNGYYEESMDLQLFMQRLVMRHPTIVLFEHLQKKCTNSANMMLNQITNLLRGPVKLPLLIRVIGYLRRMKDLSETQLAVCFLQQRDAFLESLLVEIQEPDVQSYVKRYIETMRILI